MYSTLEEYRATVNLTSGILRKANANISTLESEIQEMERRMKNEEAAEEARMEALLRTDAQRPRHAPSQPSSGNEIKHQVLDIIQRYEEDHGRHKCPSKEDVMKEMNVSESVSADRESIRAIKKALIELEREGEIGKERSDGGYDIYYPVNDEMVGNGNEDTLDPTSGVTDDAVQRSSVEAEMDEDQ